MKLVAAKCPNCGSNLDVNPKQETMKCMYCRTAILVDDAIAKYKIELSGEVEIKNLPKIENYLTLAERSYYNKDYDNAYETYGKILELDSNNPIALIRYGICKTLLNNYIDFTMEYLINSFKEVINIINNNNEYDKYSELFVLETVYAVDSSLYALRKYYNSYNIDFDDLRNIQLKLISILVCYETILVHTNDKTHIIEQIISVLNDLIRDKNYKTGTSIYGGTFLEIYKINFDDKIKLQEKLSYYQKLLHPELYEKKPDLINQENIQKGKVKGTIILIDIFLWVFIISAFISNNIISAFIMVLMFLIITFESISIKLFKENKNKKKYFIILLIVLLFFAIAMGI